MSDILVLEIYPTLSLFFYLLKRQKRENEMRGSVVRKEMLAFLIIVNILACFTNPVHNRWFNHR